MQNFVEMGGVSTDRPVSGAETIWRRTGPGWARIWRARKKTALWEEAAEAEVTSGAWRPETERRRRRPSMLGELD